MKPRRVKQFILILLCCVLVYIWWGNLKLFVGQQESYQYDQEETPAVSKQAARSDKLEYRPPQANPFRRSVGRTSGNPNRATSPPPMPVPELLHASHRLTGILPRGRSSQVIVLTPQGRSVVMELGDSLGTWNLTWIGESSAVFKQGKRNDTLWLGANKN